MAVTKPVPRPTTETRPFWDGCRRGELLIQTCADCGHRQFYPRAYCMRCTGEHLAWTRATGRGSVHSFTVVHRAPTAAFKDDVPYVVAIIDLDEGVRMLSTVVGCTPDQVSFGMQVTVVFEALDDDVALPKFQPASG